MKKLIVILACLFCTVVAFLVLGLNYFALYQLLPIILFYFFQVKVFSDIEGIWMKICYILAILILLIFPLLAQVSWYYDINGLASKSSTSGLLFVFLPIYASLPGLLICVIAFAIKSNRKKMMP